MQQDGPSFSIVGESLPMISPLAEQREAEETWPQQRFETADNSPGRKASEIHAVMQYDTLLVDDNDYVNDTLEHPPQYRMPQHFEQHKFSPLSGPGEIRVLRIPRRSGASIRVFGVNFPLCELVHVPLDSKDLEFEALSYAWGNLDDNLTHGPIFLSNGESERSYVQVPVTLHKAILRLQLEDEDRFMWVDQLCIDQHNLTERAQQVSMIPSIFSKATQTIAWLGEEDPNVCKAYEDVFQGLKCDHPDTLKQVQTRQSSDWKLMIHFFSKSWFTRTWVFQEVVLSSRILVYCGKMECDFQDIVKASDLVGSWSSGLEATHVMRCYKHMYHHDRRALSLLPLLVDTHIQFRCFDPRDKVFALLNISPESEAAKSLISYTISTREVYIRIAHFLISSTDSLDLFMAIHDRSLEKSEGVVGGDAGGHENELSSTHQHSPVELPTWVPDWAKTKRTMGIDMPSNPKFYASNGRKHPSLIQLPMNLLRVRGKLVDTVKEIMPHSFEHSNDAALHDVLPLDKLTESWMEILREENRGGLPPGLTTAAARWLLVKTAIADGVLRVESPKRSTTVEDLDYFCNLVHIDANRAILVELASAREKTEALDHECRKLLALLNVCRDRKLAVLEHHAIALIPKTARYGDLVCILHGSTVPVLLRKQKDDMYGVLGPCYVDGIMRGEAVDWDEDEADEFILQ